MAELLGRFAHEPPVLMDGAMNAELTRLGAIFKEATGRETTSMRDTSWPECA